MRVYTMKKFVTLLNRRNDLKMALDMRAKFDFNICTDEDFPVLKREGSYYRAYWKDGRNDVYNLFFDRFIKELKEKMRKRKQLASRLNWIDFKSIVRDFKESGKDKCIIECIRVYFTGDKTFVIHNVDDHNICINYKSEKIVIDYNNSIKKFNTIANKWIRQFTGEGTLFVKVDKEYSFYVYD